jgi:hypothetical protein
MLNHVTADNAYYWLAGLFFSGGFIHPILGLIVVGLFAFWVFGIYGGLGAAVVLVPSVVVTMVGIGARTAFLDWIRKPR